MLRFASALFFTTALLSAAPALADDDGAQGFADWLDRTPELYMLQVCNRSSHPARVAVSYKPPGDAHWLYKGWIAIPTGSCNFVVASETPQIFAYAEASDGADAIWGGDKDDDNDAPMCVVYPGPFEYRAHQQPGCEKYPWARHFSPSAFGTTVWNLND